MNHEQLIRFIVYCLCPFPLRLQFRISHFPGNWPAADRISNYEFEYTNAKEKNRNAPTFTEFTWTPGQTNDDSAIYDR